MDNDFLFEVDRVADLDGRYAKEAYLFIYDALKHTVENLGKSELPREQRHISGTDLLRGISEFGLSQFGPLTKTVFEHWGVNKTEDFGRIVFNLVEAELMSKTEDDSLDDFIDVYDFECELDWHKRRSEFKKKPD